MSPNEIRGLLPEGVGRGPLPCMLEVAVPLWIVAIKDRGGPLQSDYARLPAIGQKIAEHGDVLLFGSKKKGEAADLFNEVAFAVAVLSFCPGGIALFGQHWESKSGDQEDLQHGQEVP